MRVSDKSLRGIVVIFKIQNLAFELCYTQSVLRCEETKFGLEWDQRMKILNLLDNHLEDK